MFTHVRSRRSIVLFIGLLLGGAVLAGGVVAAQFRELASPEELDAAFRDAPMVKVADIPAGHGLSGRGVFLQSTSTGLLCLWDASSAAAVARQGGCNPQDDPLGGRKLFISFAYDGGPASTSVTDARLIGLVSADVSAVEVAMSDGTRRKIALRKSSVATHDYGAFGHRISSSDLKRGVTPTAVVAFNEAGQEIDRQATGVAG
jgi:hypothetical protein